MNESSRPAASTRAIVGGVALVVVGGLTLVALFGGGTREPAPVSPATGNDADSETLPPREAGQPAVIDPRDRPPSVEGLLQQIRDLRRESKAKSNQGRLEAIRSLGELRSQRSRDALREIAKDGSDRFERLTAMNVIWAGGDRDYLVNLAASSNDPVVQAKVDALRAAEGNR